jgi:hypothetical protein
MPTNRIDRLHVFRAAVTPGVPLAGRASVYGRAMQSFDLAGVVWRIAAPDRKNGC